MASSEQRPRWVTALALVAAVLVLAAIVIAVVGGGHGPDLHGRGDARPGGSSPRSVAADPGRPWLDHG